MIQNEFLVHACEQVLRFTQVEKWSDLTEARKVQLGFNMGVMALGLDLEKEQSFDQLAAARTESITMKQFNQYLGSIVNKFEVQVDNKKVAKSI